MGEANERNRMACSRCGKHTGLYEDVTVESTAWRHLDVFWDDEHGQPNLIAGDVDLLSSMVSDTRPVGYYGCGECGQRGRASDVFARPLRPCHGCGGEGCRVCGYEGRIDPAAPTVAAEQLALEAAA